MLRAGARVTCDGIPVELLWLVEGNDHRQIWRCRTLFVDESREIVMTFRAGEQYRQIHGTLALTA